MRVLLCGADGFLGRAIARRLAAAGHQIVRAVHHPRHSGDLKVDYRTDLSPADWTPRLRGIDGVVNAVGILREARPGDFERIHHRTPAALFHACARAGVRRVVQISALGCVEPPPYLSSKHAADAALLKALPEGGGVLRPGLVFGIGGASTRFFLALASLPLHVLPVGAGRVQPVHVEDVATAVLRLLEEPVEPSRVVALPGPRALTYPEWQAAYRRLLGLGPALRLPVPSGVMSLAARLAGGFRRSLLCRETWHMLSRGNVADPAPAVRLLGRALRDPAAFVTANEAPALRLEALALWRRPLLQGMLAAIWLGTALVSAGLYPVSESLALLARFGLEGSPAVTALAGATVLDLGMGVLTLMRPGRRLWLSQLALVAAYTLLVAWRLPEFLLHPFGPILKNLAVAALLIQLLSEEERR